MLSPVTLPSLIINQCCSLLFFLLYLVLYHLKHAGLVLCMTAQSSNALSKMYLERYQPLTLDLVSSHLNVDDRVQLFSNRCCDILDIIAPRKIINLNRKSQPWMNSDMKVLRQQCCQCECNWKKDGLKVYEMLKDSLHNYCQKLLLF